jgi:enamine deaminase RidA (YjgF/YER057c/UK114 family)
MAGNESGTRLPRTENPVGVPRPGGHYSHVAIANGLVFVSGQLPIDAQGRAHGRVVRGAGRAGACESQGRARERRQQLELTP